MRKLKKTLAVFLSVVMILCAAGISSYAQVGQQRTVSELPFASISDLHYYPVTLMGKNEDGSDNQAWLDYCRLHSKMYNESETIIRTALETIGQKSKENGIKYILVPGDLTKDSEYAAHADVAKILEEYEEKYGFEFLVINGNHDINTTSACTFENGKHESARAIKASEFPKVYANLGYDLAIDRYAYPENGDEVQGALSYVADLDDDYRLIVIDSCMYTFDEPFKQQTGGKVTDELMAWVKKWVDDAKANGKTPMVMAHHGLAAHMEVEPSITFAFPLENYMEVSETLASWGVNYAFTGHLHTNDVACVTNDDGETLYDYETPSLTGYPNMYRENVVSKKANGETALTTAAADFDAVEKMTFDGVTYDNGTYKRKAFSLCYGGGLNDTGKPNATDFLMGIVKSYLGGVLDSIVENGGVLEYLKTLNIDLEEILSNFLAPYIGDGIRLGSYNIFSVDNLMWFIEDLLDQVTELYIKDPTDLYELLYGVIDELMSIKVSDKPCTKFIDTLDFGDASKPGDLGDLILSVLFYWDCGNEDTSDDAFVLDAIDGFENGNTANVVFDTLVDLLLHDVIEDAVLAKLEIRIDKLFADDKIQKNMGDGINYLLNHVLRGDFTYMNLVNIVFGLGVLPYTSIYDTLDKLLISRYLTDSQLESVGIFVAYVLKDFTSDTNPIFKGDSEVTYTSALREVEVSTKNYRLPTMISVTMGDDSKTQANISWFSKSTLEATDIEIYKADSEPTFNGVPTAEADFTISTTSKLTERTYPGIDLGVIGFFWYSFDMMQHSVSLSDLEPGATYYYRVGNAQYGWWSETGKLKTADGSNEVTFFHMTDPQAQNERQYNRGWKTVLQTAFNMYPDAAFVMTTGDLVDHGDNVKLWQYMFDCASDSLMNTYLMPVTGNHEGYGTNATATNFVLPNMPEQNTETGVYYSYDYNNVHVAVLNTEKLGENDALSDDQIEWLKADMAKSDAQWKFVALHKALYSQGSHYADDDVCAMREQLGALMPQLDVDVVFEGHDHVYMRTYSLDSNEKVSVDYKYLSKDGNIYKTQIAPAGTTYEIAGCSGVKAYIANDVTATDKYFPRAAKTYSVDAPMFSAIRIENNVMYFDAYTVGENGAESIDRFAIQKDNSVLGNEVSDYNEPDEEISENEALKTFKTVIEYMIKIVKVVLNIFRIYVVKVEL